MEGYLIVGLIRHYYVLPSHARTGWPGGRKGARRDRVRSRNDQHGGTHVEPCPSLSHARDAPNRHPMVRCGRTICSGAPRQHSRRCAPNSMRRLEITPRAARVPLGPSTPAPPPALEALPGPCRLEWQRQTLSLPYGDHTPGEYPTGTPSGRER